jgi:tetratricopeptide (TPR) repeat protein
MDSQLSSNYQTKVVSRFANRRIHFIGIGGCGMSGLARMLLDAGRYDEALELFAEGLREHPSNPSLLYNLACAEARAARTEDAVAHLREAIAGDGRWAERARTDPDFDGIRGAPGFPVD